MTVRSSVMAGWLALVGVSLVPGAVAAYCVEPNFALLWNELEQDPDQDPSEPITIPVYVSIGTNTSVEHAGLTSAEVVRLTREIIARHNEAATGPVLVYMGLTRSDMDYRDGQDNQTFAARPFGITVDSYSCAWREDHAPCGGGFLRRGCANSASSVPKARVTLVPVGCDPAYPPHSLVENDLATVMLHEFGHMLGLGHSQVSQAECELDPAWVHGNAATGNDGVMRAQIGANFPALREWRRDDLDGLAAIYGRSPPAALIGWDDGVFPHAPLPSQVEELAGIDAHRPLAVSSGTGPAHYLATVDANDHVTVQARTSQGLGPAEVVDPSPAGRSWGNPGLALGDATLFVVWSAHEKPEDNRVSLRWATRPLTEPAWTRAEFEPEANARVKRLAAGYAPGVDRFLIASLTDYEARPRVSVIDADGVFRASHVLDSPGLFDGFGLFGLFDIGNPSCVATNARTRARCVLPYSTNEFAGPKLGWLEFELDGADEITPLGAQTTTSTAATGKLGFASRPDQAGLRGSAGAQRYALDLFAGIIDNDLPDPLPSVDADAWPIMLGSRSVSDDLDLDLDLDLDDDGQTRWWAYARRRVVCGDAVAQASEQCDDGNTIPGDGCTGRCRLEHEMAGELAPADEDGMDTVADGTGGDFDSASDCECRAGPIGPGAPFGPGGPFGPCAVVLAVWAGRRGSRSPTHAGRVRAGPGRV